MALKSVWSGLSLATLNSIPCRSASRADNDYEKNRPTSKLYIHHPEPMKELAAEFESVNMAKQVEILKKVAQSSAIYMTIDTYLYLILAKQLGNGAGITSVFPWPADQPCPDAPPQQSYAAEIICRNVATYYHQLARNEVCYKNRKKYFVHKASNTLTYRAYAPYQMIPKEERRTICPAKPGWKVLQFDWTAAEWVLILQFLGYEPPEDAYQVFTEDGLERESTKLVILARIYRAQMETLCKERDPILVQGICSLMDRTYPKAMQMSDILTQTPYVDFEGFRIELGDIPYKRPNHFAQTALQLCKWDLMNRLCKAGVSHLGAGDLHDQLYFHFNPADPQSVQAITTVVEEIKKPCFSRYNLRPKISINDFWQ